MTTPASQREQPELLIPYWLRAVRVGILITVLTVGSLVFELALPGHDDFNMPWYLAILGAGALGVVVVALLPWRRLFERGLGVWFLYLWSAGDILLISLAVIATGGVRSEVFLVYGLTTVFFGATYPPRGQLGLLAFTFACYLASLGLTGWHVNADVLFLRLAVIGMLALLAFFLSSELMREMGAAEEARGRA